MAADENHQLEDELFLEIDKQYFGTEILDSEESLLLYGILKAVAEGNLEKVKKIAANSGCLNLNDSSGNTPLHIAILKNNKEILDFLLAQTNIDLNISNFNGETPLFLAIKTGEIEVAKKLVHHGANVNVQNYENVAPLHLAVTYPDLAFELISKGAYLDATDYSGDTPLHDAVAEECLETVCMLLYHNADANVRGVNNLTPFMKAIISKNAEIQVTLLNYVDDFNVETYDYITTLALSIINKSPLVEEIIEGGGDVNYAYGYDLVDIFSLCLQYPNAKNFKLVWDRLKYDGVDMSLGSVLWRISGTLRKEFFKQYIDIIIESDNLEQVVDSISTADDFYMVIVRFCDFFNQLSLDQLTKLTCRLLTFGYVVTSFDMSKVFLHYGYCEVFKILLHMDIRPIGQRPPDTSRIIYDVNTNMDTLLNQVVSVINIEYLHNTIYQILDYCVYPKLMNGYLDLNRDDYVTFKILHLPRVPSLLELCRNKSREVLISNFNVKTSGQLYTLINHMELNGVYKKILSFEKKLYIPSYVFTPKTCKRQY
ncbi:unnamed protein product [Phaedon cochleariae]|uniref:Ankyrin repeat-containing protein n=1 Tax=Phaedon cochleariae TaxID=80249 RepID=A0A9N9SA87_PHACE|nr:unnamed protein product [Phaedon cochleariae]